jgi:hypothetical protein
MGAIQRIMSNDVACREVALDFSRAPAERHLFPGIEPDVVPGASAEADSKIRNTVVHLHQQVLGRDDAPDSPEVQRTVRLFTDILRDAAQQKHSDGEIYACRLEGGAPVSDPNYTLRAWRAVVTYLLRRNEFLYE